MDRRIAGEGSSPSLSTTQKSKLWFRLRYLDRKITQLDKDLLWASQMYQIGDNNEKRRKQYEMLNKKYEDIDLKRKEVRKKLKHWKGENHAR